MKLGCVAAALLVTLTACGGSDADSADALEDAAQEQADRFSSGDFGGAWDMWTDEAKDVMGRDDYVTFGEACANAGVPLEVADARVEDDGTGTVRIGLGDFNQSYTMRYEDNEWSWVPTDEALELYAMGVDEAIATAQEDGSCIEP